ncbi:hypothetical protein EG329_002325 [Mollisiaceae sp. DMI_Dod_QoI]|nr:hypothetical protein EG329_002325 [Helotiales sp. DMI_Dod_QoI]
MFNDKDKKKGDSLTPSRSKSKTSYKPSSATMFSRKETSHKPGSSTQQALRETSSSGASSSLALPSKLDRTKGPSGHTGSTPLYLSKVDKTKTPATIGSFYPPTKHASQAGSQRTAPLASAYNSSPQNKISSSSSAKEPQKIGSSYPDKYKPQMSNSIADRTKSTAGSSQPSNMVSISGSAMKSKAPSFAKSTFTSRKDEEMAKRQTKFESLPPSERVKQEEWAQDQIRQQGLCPGRVPWIRVPGGYQCIAVQHYMTDEILAEGKGGMFFFDIFSLSGTSRVRKYLGPYYLDKSFGRLGIWKLGDVKDKPDYLPDEHTFNGIPIVKGMVDIGDQRISKEQYERMEQERGCPLSGVGPRTNFGRDDFDVRGFGGAWFAPGFSRSSKK